MLHGPDAPSPAARPESKLPILHTRIDLIRGLDGELAVMELELIEPYLFPEQGGGAAGMGERFAEVLSRMLSA